MPRIIIICIQQIKLTIPLIGAIILVNHKSSSCGFLFHTTCASYAVLQHTNEGLEAGHTLADDDVVKVTDKSSSNHYLLKDPIVDVDHVQRGTEYDKNNEMEVTEPKSEEKPSSWVSMPENFTSEEIRNHITSLIEDSQVILKKKEIVISDDNDPSCSLCGIETRLFKREDYCFSCDKLIRRDSEYYCRKAEQDTEKEQWFCVACFKKYKGDCIKINGENIKKELLNHKINNENDNVEGWVQCDKCKRRQHQICALFDEKRNSEGQSQYVCPKCCLKEIEEGTRTPLKTANFGAKDLPRTKLGDHLEERLYSRLQHEKAQKAKAEGKNVDDIVGPENLSVRVAQSAQQQLKVKNEFLDIVPKANYPPEFPYTSKVILLFQNIDGADVLIYVIFVQEFGSDCSHPNNRSVHISYLDSVKYFRPERKTVTGEALRTYVYHEILIGYLEFCKKRGFGTCYIWSCPPKNQGDDYVLYCHPENQKTPKDDQLRQWYLSMISKATEEDIVVNCTNMLDQFFVTSGKSNSKVTAARLPYFDGDYWSSEAVVEMMKIEKKYKKDPDKLLKEVGKRSVKTMGHTEASKDNIKDILVMQKLKKVMLIHKEDFIIAQLQYPCAHCHEMILSGKRWFCPKCKKYQQCERCHTSDTHVSNNGEEHILQAVVDYIPSDTKENDIILESDIFKTRIELLNFCQEDHLQFNTLRHAKYTTMKIIDHLKSSALIDNNNGDPRCNICYYKDDDHDNGSHQLIWQGDICPKLHICSTCYEKKGANNCHELKLRNSSSSSSSDHVLPENQASEEHKIDTKQQQKQVIAELLKHAFHCNSAISQPCSYPECDRMKKWLPGELKRSVLHLQECSVKEHGGCNSCKKARGMLNLHSRTCKENKCCFLCEFF